MRIVDLSGFMFSGKSALSDLLREFDRVFVPPVTEEFDLLRISGGLIDLKGAVECWSPIRNHSAINRFERIVKKWATAPRFPLNLFKTGSSYGRRYPKLSPSLESFLEEIVVVEYETPWPYDDFEDGVWQTFKRKLLAKFGIVKNRLYRLTSADVFYPAAQKFVCNVLSSEHDDSKIDTIVTHNALEPFNPDQNLILLGKGAQCIVIDRDPRDIYLNVISIAGGSGFDNEFYKRIAGATSVDLFISRYKLYRSMIKPSGKNILRIMFEDLIDNYETTKARVLDFLQIEQTAHVNQFKYFDPKKSAKNVRLWEKDEFKKYNKDMSIIAEKCLIPK
jgi:hypothetical protein